MKITTLDEMCEGYGYGMDEQSLYTNVENYDKALDEESKMSTNGMVSLGYRGKYCYGQAIPTENDGKCSEVASFASESGVKYTDFRESRWKCEDVPPTPPTPVINVTSVTLDQTAINLNIGDTSTLVATVLPNDASDKSVSWTSSDDTIATVDANGVVTAVAAGSATITVTTTDGGFTAQCSVSATTPVIHVTSVSLDKTTLNLNVGNSETIVATVLPNDATDKSVTWSTSNSGVATVDSDGNVTAVASGDATITVTTTDGGLTAQCSVSVTTPIPVSVINYTATSQLNILLSDFTPNATADTYDSATQVGQIEFAANVTEIGYHAFISKTQLTSIDIPNTVTSIGDGAFQNCTSLTSVTIPNSVTSIEGEAFSGCSSLENITIPTGITTINYSVFKDCSSLTNICIPVSVTSIGGSAFACCSSFTSVTIPSGVTNIGDEAFSGCSGLNLVMVDATTPPTLFGSWVFDETNDCPIYVPCESQSAYEAAENWSGYVGRITCPAIHVASVSLDQTVLNLNAGDTSTLVATVLPSNATDPSVTWSSSDSTIATVDANGLVTAVADGSATITVTTNDGGLTAQCSVSVTTPITSVTSVTLDQTVLNLNVGNSETLVATVLPSDATDKSVTWSSSDDSIATVDSNGLVTAVANGSATITVTTNDGGLTAQCSVSVTTLVTSVSLDQTVLNLNVGDSETLVATVLPNDATDKSVTWSSSDSTIASVDANGVVTAVANGSATITVTTVDGGHTAQCSVSVTTPVTSVSLNKTVLDFYGASGSETLIATVLPSDATDKSVTWSTSNSGAATVDSNGVVTPISGGSATITVTTTDGGFTAQCTVYVIVASIAYTATSQLNVNFEKFTPEAMDESYDPSTQEGIIKFGDYVTGIGNSAFYGQSSLISISIPNSVTSIGEDVFASCTSLTTVNIPTGVTSIGGGAFYECGGLTTVNIPDGVTSIGNGAFYECGGLTSIIIPSSVTEIGGTAFRHCSGLTSITIPSNVTNIGNSAFDACTSLVSITCEATTPPSLGGNAFTGTNNCPIYVPSGSVDTYKAASGWSNYASRIQAIP